MSATTSNLLKQIIFLNQNRYYKNRNHHTGQIVTSLNKYYKLISTNATSDISICSSIRRRKRKSNLWSSLPSQLEVTNPNIVVRTISSSSITLFREITAYGNSNESRNSSENKNEFLQKVTQRILSTKVGELNQASLFELTTSISSWHSKAISNNHDRTCFYKANELFDRLIQELIFTCYDGIDIDNKASLNKKSNAKVNVKITVETINLLLDSWRIINNTNWATTRKLSKATKPNEKDIAFANHGITILNKCIEISTTYGESKCHYPNIKSFNMVLDGFSKLGMVDNAKELFNQMEILSSKQEEGAQQCRPDRISYNSLLFALANSYSNQVENANKASEILENMLNVYNQTGNEEIKPDGITFAIVISAYANAAPLSFDAPYQAENIIKLMIDMYTSSLVENGGDGEWIHLRPNSSCYTSLIEAWSNSGSSEGVDRAVDILATMQSVNEGKRIDGIEHVSGNINKHVDLMDKIISSFESTGDESTMPSSVTFVVLIDCLAQSAARKVGGDRGDAALKSENIVKKMEDLYEAGNDRMKPTTSVYNALINAWAKSLRPDAGKRAEEWLEKIEKMYLSGEDVKPDLFTFSSTIQAYANVNNGKDAERIFMRMYEAYNNGDGNCKPNPITFSTVINAYANRGEPREAERFMRVVNNLQGLEGFEFDPYCQNCVLKAHINSHASDSTKTTLQFLKTMDKRGVSDAVAYASVIEKLSKVGNIWAAEEGERLLSRMWDLYEEGNVKLKPTTSKLQ